MIPLDELRSQISIIDTYNRYIGGHLIRRGRNWWAKCTWHGNDSSPSLKLYTDQNKWYCYGCSEGGTQIDMVMKALGLSFKDAIKQLSIDFGIADMPLLDKLNARQRQRQAVAAKETENYFSTDFDRIYVKLCHVSGWLHRAVKNVRICLRYPKIFDHILKIDLLIDEMYEAITRGDRQTQVDVWRRARTVFPWLKT